MCETNTIPASPSFNEVVTFRLQLCGSSLELVAMDEQSMASLGKLSGELDISGVAHEVLRRNIRMGEHIDRLTLPLLGERRTFSRR